MEIQLKTISIGELMAGYIGDPYGGAVCYGGRLNIRPLHEREFVYKDKQRDAVIETVQKNAPLDVMYWGAAPGGGKLEIIDGQQRLVSVCKYVSGKFTVGRLFFHNLEDDLQKKFLDYKLQVYFCAGTNAEKLEWFKTRNFPGKPLTAQELRNAVYAGPWVGSAKRIFGKTGCPAYRLGGRYLAGLAKRQEYLETVVGWISNGDIEGYMERRQYEEDARELWEYLREVVAWTQTVFPNYRKEMKGLPWGEWYNKHGGKQFCAAKLEAEISRRMRHAPAAKKAGVYETLICAGRV